MTHEEYYDSNGSLLRSKKFFQLITKENVDESDIKEALGKYEIYDVDVELIREEPISYSHVEVAQTILMPVPTMFMNLMKNNALYDMEVDKYFGIHPRLGRASFNLNGIDYEINVEFCFTKSKARGIFYCNLSKKVKEGHWYRFDSAEITKWPSDVYRASTFFVIDGKRIVIELFEEYNSKWDD